MKQPVYLKSFEYSIPASGSNAYGFDNLNQDFLEMHLPQVKVNIDFENQYLFIEGNGDMAKTLSKKVGLTRFDFDYKKIKVNANIYCGLNINLSASSEEGLVYILEGIIDDGECKNPCTGLLIIDNRSTSQQSGDDEWDLRVHLFDSVNEEKEINIDLIISSMSQNAELN
jgi:hypothetical protein